MTIMEISFFKKKKKTQLVVLYYVMYNNYKYNQSLLCIRCIISAQISLIFILDTPLQYLITGPQIGALTH